MLPVPVIAGVLAGAALLLTRPTRPLRIPGIEAGPELAGGIVCALILMTFGFLAASTGSASFVSATADRAIPEILTLIAAGALLLHGVVFTYFTLRAEAITSDRFGPALLRQVYQATWVLFLGSLLLSLLARCAA